MRQSIVGSAGVLAVLLCSSGFVAQSEELVATGRNEDSHRHEAVLAMHPLGYWPADEHSGDTLRDLSQNGNPGTVYQIRRENGLLDFTGGFQWGEIPSHPKYQLKEFTIGGWLFNRRESYEARGMLFLGIAYPIRIETIQSLSLRIKEGRKVEVVSGGEPDVVGSMADQETVAVNQWQHVLYTYAAGTGTLYVDGHLVRSKNGVRFESQNLPLLLGCDASWWMLHPPGSKSLDGSIRDVVLFDRALAPKEVADLVEATCPSVQPRILGEDAVVLDGRQVLLMELLTLAVDDRRRALEDLEGSDASALQQRSDALLPILTIALDELHTRRVAANLLVKLDIDEARAALANAMPVLIQTVQDENVPREERATSALALAGMKSLAIDAVPTLVTTLNGVLEKEGVRLPRVDDLLRNALIRSLIDIDPRNEQARDLLGLALAKPVLDLLDLSQTSSANEQLLMDNGRYMDALDVYRTLPREQRVDRFFSQGDVHRDTRGDIHDGSYTAVADYKGFTYTLGEGKGFKGVEQISKEDFENVVNEVAEKYPAARTWREADSPNLCRVKITKSGEDGTLHTAYLEGDTFVFDGTDAKVRGWSVAVDNGGYIHVVGGQHNYPDADAYIPGSWEKLGLSRDPTSEQFPNQMYWVSRKPGDIESFEFVGRSDNPRQIPSPQYLNYMNFVQDNQGELFLYGRINVGGFQSWGLYHYNVDARRWITLGGDACDVIASAKENDPSWGNYLISQVRGFIPDTPGTKSLVWAWQPHFYNYCRSMWGIRFDKSNRMHIFLPIRGLGVNARILDSEVYAFSDDDGETFQRADSTNVELPLTINPAPPHLADIRSHSTEQWWNLWFSLLRYAGLE